MLKPLYFIRSAQIMVNKSEIIEQTNLAFDFVQKLYLEVSYLIKEIEGILHEEEEKFIIGKPAGYSISARSSTGLESTNVNLWLLRKFAVFFVPEDKTEIKRGQTITRIDENLKILYLRIVLTGKNINEPAVYSGVLYNIQKKPQVKWIVKFENVMGHLEYSDDKIFKNAEKIDYEDAYIKIQGELVKNNLFEINDSGTILKKIIKPSLDLFRKY
ncbi:hypothetical protein ES703_117036 [subsurface metagenome]